MREMKFEKIKGMAENLFKKIGGDLNKVSSIDSRIMVQQTGSFTPASTIPNIGRDYGFINAAQKLDVNKISEPVKGLRGYYLIKVSKRTPFDKTIYSAQSSNIRNMLFQEKRSRFLNQWVTDIKKSADIIDNRYLFYRQ